MSVCLATMAENRSCFVIATDQKVSLGDVVTIDEVMVKLDFLNHPSTPAPFWAALWAGKDITAIPPIIRRTQKVLRQGDSPKPPLTADRIAEVMAESYQMETRKRIQAEVLSQYDLDFVSFTKEGEKMFGDHFGSVLAQIDQVRLGAEFLVCGFESAHEATMFTVGERGVVEYQDKMGFWIIGSGNQLALSALALRRHNREKSLVEAICNVLEAKFCAELSDSVGNRTTVAILGMHDYLRLVPPSVIDSVRASWDAQGGLRPPVPPEAMETVSGWLVSSQPGKVQVMPLDPTDPTTDSSGQPPSPE